jgi:hypothetical protein
MTATLLLIVLVLVVVYAFLYLFNLFFTPTDPPLLKAKQALNVVVWLVVFVWVVLRLVALFTGTHVRLP